MDKEAVAPTHCSRWAPSPEETARVSAVLPVPVELESYVLISTFDLVPERNILHLVFMDCSVDP